MPIEAHKESGTLARVSGATVCGDSSIRTMERQKRKKKSNAASSRDKRSWKGAVSEITMSRCCGNVKKKSIFPVHLRDKVQYASKKREIKVFVRSSVFIGKSAIKYKYLKSLQKPIWNIKMFVAMHSGLSVYSDRDTWAPCCIVFDFVFIISSY